MPLKVYDTQDAVPEEERDEYVEHDGKWRAKPEVELAVEKRKRTELLAEKKAEKERREAAEQKLAEAERAAEARARGISEEELQKIRDAEAAARQPIEAERDALKAENRKLKLTDRVQALYLANGGMPDRVDDAMEALARRTDLGDKDGIVFKDKDGNVTADDAKAFFAKHKTEKPWFYAGAGASGSGAGGSNGAGDTLPAADAQRIADRHRQRVASAF